jgi:protein-tyrosine-phosphatase
MDRNNLSELRELAAPAAFGPLDDYHANIRMLTAAGTDAKLAADVRDPIGRGIEAYRETYHVLVEACERLLAEFQ